MFSLQIDIWVQFTHPKLTLHSQELRDFSFVYTECKPFGLRTGGCLPLMSEYVHKTSRAVKGIGFYSKEAVNGFEVQRKKFNTVFSNLSDAVPGVERNVLLQTRPGTDGACHASNALSS